MANTGVSINMLNDFFTIDLPQPNARLFSGFQHPFEELFNSVIKDSGKTGELFSWEGEEDGNTHEWITFSRHHTISPEMMKSALVLCIMLARINAARAQPDDNALHYFHDELKNLTLKAKNLIKSRELSPQEICLLHYVQSRISISRLQNLL